MSWTNAVDADLQTALSLSRAQALALMKLSPTTARALIEALEDQIRSLEAARSPASQAAAASLRELLAKAA